MSDTNAPVLDPQTSAAPNAMVEKRSIQMKHFRDKASIERCIKENTAVPLGQIVGHAFECKLKEGRLPDGTPSVSPMLLGDFEAVRYATGEVISASSAYLPRYFVEVIQAALTKGAGAVNGISFAIEVLVEPTGKGITEGIQYQYAIKNLRQRSPDSPIEAMKRELAAAGQLRLPAARPAPSLALNAPAEDHGDGNDSPFTEGEADKPTKGKRH